MPCIMKMCNFFSLTVLVLILIVFGQTFLSLLLFHIYAWGKGQYLMKKNQNIEIVIYKISQSIDCFPNIFDYNSFVQTILS